MNLKCANAYILKDNELHPIKCRITQKTCVCCSCTKHDGYVMNPWVIDCPVYKEIREEDK
jgi:hypothetical protein